MIRVNVYVEGQSEETFVRDVLGPAYLASQIYFNPILAETKPGYKGGIVSYVKTKKQLQRLCKQDPSAYVTTLIDYYGLPPDFPMGQTLQQGANLYQQIIERQNALEQDIRQPNFIANYMLHEFEALLFTQPEYFAQWIENAPIEELTQIKNNFKSPEHINNNRETAPSKRILKLVPEYNKVLHGPLITGDIGLVNIRQQCLHFDNWLKRIEQLNQ